MKDILVFVDFMDSETEIPKYKKFLKQFKDIKATITDTPDFDNISKYSHVFIDFGGLSQPGNSLFSSMCSQWDKIIVNYPNIYFILISVMGKEWFENDMFKINETNVLCMANFADKEEFLKIMEK